MHRRTNKNKRISHPEQSGGDAIVRAIITVGGNCDNTQPPSAPTKLLDRHDLARLFVKNIQTPKRWDREGWITPVRKPNGRIIGYEPHEVCRLAVRIFSRFGSSAYDKKEAKLLGYAELLDWVIGCLGISNKTANQPDLSSSQIAWLFLASLTGDSKCLPSGFGATTQELSEMQSSAKQQLSMRVHCPRALEILIKAWNAAGAIAVTLTDSNKNFPYP